MTEEQAAAMLALLTEIRDLLAAQRPRAATAGPVAQPMRSEPTVAQAIQQVRARRRGSDDLT